MLGTLIFLVILVVVIPVSVAHDRRHRGRHPGLGLKDNGEATHEGSELIELT